MEFWYISNSITIVPMVDQALIAKLGSYDAVFTKVINMVREKTRKCFYRDDYSRILSFIPQPGS